MKPLKPKNMAICVTYITIGLLFGLFFWDHLFGPFYCGGGGKEVDH